VFPVTPFLAGSPASDLGSAVVPSDCSCRMSAEPAGSAGSCRPAVEPTIADDHTSCDRLSLDTAPRPPASPLGSQAQILRKYLPNSGYFAAVELTHQAMNGVDTDVDWARRIPL